MQALRFESVCARHAQPRQGARPATPHDAAVIENFLKLRGGLFALPRRQVRLPANVRGIHAGNIQQERNLPQFQRRRNRFERAQRARGIFFIQRQLRADRRKPQRLDLRVQRVSLAQRLRHRFGSRRVAGHRVRQRGFQLHALARRRQLQRIRRGLLRIRAASVCGLLHGFVRLPDGTAFLAVCFDCGFH